MTSAEDHIDRSVLPSRVPRSTERLDSGLWPLKSMTYRKTWASFFSWSQLWFDQQQQEPEINHINIAANRMIHGINYDELAISLLDIRINVGPLRMHIHPSPGHLDNVFSDFLRLS